MDRTLTPRMAFTQVRPKMILNEADWIKIGRGRRWSAIVTDQRTGKRYRIRGASCGLPRCYCDAIAYPVDWKPSG